MKLVLLHGLGQTAASWEETIANVANDWHIHTPNLFRDKGLLTYDQLYDAFVQECETYSEPFHLCGVSLGAIIACQYAVEHPSKVKSLIVIGVQLKPSTFLLKLQKFIFNILPQSYFKKHGLNKEQLLVLSQSIQNLNIKIYMQNIQCPAIAICGKKDRFNLKATKEFAQLVPQARYELIEHAGHEVNIEKQVELGIAIEQFLIGKGNN